MVGHGRVHSDLYGNYIEDIREQYSHRRSNDAVAGVMIVDDTSVIL